MSQLTIKKSAISMLKQYQSDIVVLLGFFLASFSFRSAVFLYPALAFFVQRSRREAAVAATGVLLGSLRGGVTMMYCQLLLLTVMLLLICLIQLLHQSCFAWLPAICGITVLLASLATGMMLPQAIAGGITGVLVCRMCQSDWLWIDQQFRLSGMMLGFFCSSVIYASLSLVPWPLSEGVLIVMLAASSAMLKLKEALTLITGLAVSLPASPALAVWGMALLLVSALRQETVWIRLGIWLMPAIWAQLSWQSLSAGLIAFLLMQVLPAGSIRTRWVNEEDFSLKSVRMENRRRTLLHQLTQFSRIFDLIADYVRESWPAEARFLDGMAQALETTTMQMKQCAADEEALGEKLVNLLEGYHFEVRRIQVQPWDDGPLQIVLDFAELSRADLQEVVMPLIQQVVDKDLKVVRFQRNRIFYSGSRLELATSTPSRLKTRLYSMKAQPECSGDTGAVFRCGAMTICTISDGMGTGWQAGKASQFVTGVLQRMISAHLPVEAAVHSINALLHADHRERFATLDFLCYDHRRHQAYLSKSGACPTYLIRGEQVMEISGESLPIGIIQEIEADCFQIDCEDQDLFVMSSDGVEKQLLDQWIRSRDTRQIVQRIEAGLKAMELAGCKDDVTVLIARVSKS